MGVVFVPSLARWIFDGSHNGGPRDQLGIKDFTDGYNTNAWLNCKQTKDPADPA
jgi:hypothetical protein